VLVENGKVKAGQTVALSGDTQSKGSFHAHLEIVQGKPDDRWEDYWGAVKGNRIRPREYLKNIRK
jgi:murein DD-endopeptidase MepM/ murein hydrolase activator NlpD